MPFPSAHRRDRRAQIFDWSLGALALALAGVGVLTGTVLVVRLIALLSGKPASVLAAPNAGLGYAIYGAVCQPIGVRSGGVSTLLELSHAAIDGQLLVHMLREGLIHVLVGVIWRAVRPRQRSHGQHG